MNAPPGADFPTLSERMVVAFERAADAFERIADAAEHVAEHGVALHPAGDFAAHVVTHPGAPHT